MEEIVEVRKEIELETLYFQSYHAVNRFKSVRRAMRRGLVNPLGWVAPKRPFNNRKRTLGRQIQVDKERIYENLKYKQSL